jgi:poly(3-hydroxybutyrate) depolymerase
MNSAKARWFILLITILPCSIHSQQLDYKGFPEWSWQREGSTEYMLYTPSGIKPGIKYPLAVFLHGCCGEDEHATLRNAVDPPVRMWHHFGENYQSEPTYIIAPKTTRGWKQKFPDIKSVIDKLIAAGRVDAARIYMTGFSMGGAGTWQFMEQYPGYLAAAIPMGMAARASLEAVSSTPVWAIRGENDWHARNLPQQIDSMRRLNGDARGPLEWVTGVNPRYTSFEGVGHGVQWDAASRLPLLEWAYSKVNDGNIYPVVHFLNPDHGTILDKRKKTRLQIHASDPDGSIERVQVLVNSKMIKAFDHPPFTMDIRPASGDNLIEAVAFDKLGKSSTARLLLQVDIDPEMETPALPAVKAGAYCQCRIVATGNQPLVFSLSEGSRLPLGISLDSTGLLSGVPSQPGSFPFRITVTDAGNNDDTRSFMLEVGEKDPGEVIISGVHYPADSLEARVSKIMIGELPNTQTGSEVSFSEVGQYEGLTYIATSRDAANLDLPDLLAFTVDEDAIVYVAYERLDHLFASTIPEWLKDFKKEAGDQIVAQYHYFDVYSKRFQAGEIILPGAAAASHNVMWNYFIMVKKQD